MNISRLCCSLESLPTLYVENQHVFFSFKSMGLTGSFTPKEKLNEAVMVMNKSLQVVHGIPTAQVA